jgi:hypothetical protein
MKHNRTPGSAEDKGAHRIAVDESCATDYDEDESDDFHDSSVSDGSVDDPTPDEFALPRVSSPEKFFVKLKRQLSNLGVRYERLTKKTAEGEAPPCFVFADTDYDAWLTAASLTSDVPHRYDMPGEPNYCRDCTVQFRQKAMLAGKCIFKNVIFETSNNNGEKEVVGVSRSPKVLPVGYRVFREMVVDDDAVVEEKSS